MWGASLDTTLSADLLDFLFDSLIVTSDEVFSRWATRMNGDPFSLRPVPLLLTTKASEV